MTPALATRRLSRPSVTDRTRTLAAARIENTPSTRPRRQQSREARPHPFGMSQLALPDRDDRPAQAPQRRRGATIPLDVALELRQPEPSPRRGCRRVTASAMAMPEAAVHEDRGAKPRQHEIRTPRQMGTMEAKPVPESVDQRAHRPLRPGVLAADPRHEQGAIGRREHIAGPRAGHGTNAHLGHSKHRRSGAPAVENDANPSTIRATSLPHSADILGPWQ